MEKQKFTITILASLLSLLGFVTQSCDDNEAMYGCPTATFKANGKVTDEEGQALADAKIEVRELFYVKEDETQIPYYREGLYSEELTSVLTKKNGAFNIERIRKYNPELKEEKEIEYSDFLVIVSKEVYKPDTTLVGSNYSNKSLFRFMYDSF